MFYNQLFINVCIAKIEKKYLFNYLTLKINIMFPVIFITICSLSLSVLLVRYFENKDVIRYLSKRGCECYLIGKSIYDNQTTNIDIYVKFSDEKELYEVLRYYGDVKVVSFQYKNYFYDVFLITIDDVKYEFTSNLLNGCVLDKQKILIENLYDIPSKQRKPISDVSWNCNILQEYYLEDIENIFRCFKDASYYNLNLEYSTLEFIKKSLKDTKKYRNQVIYDELNKILNNENSYKYIQIMNDIKVLEYVGIELKDAGNLIKILKNNKYVYENPIYFLNAIKTDNLKKYMLEKNVKESRLTTRCIRIYALILNEFFNKFLEIKNGYDCIKLLQSIKLKYNFLSYDNLHEILELFDNYKKLNDYIIEFDYMDFLERVVFDDSCFPLITKELRVDKETLIEKYNVSGINLHTLRNGILDEIHNNRLVNEYDYIIEFLEKDKKN
jgi:hypothetical protein